MKNNIVKAQFDARSSKFSRSASWVTDPGLLAAHRRALKGLLPAKGRLLEACCGTGEVTGALKRRGLETFGFDLSTGMLGKAARHIKHLKPGDAHAIPFPDGFFDAVVMRQAMQFLKPGVFLKEAARVLKPGGVLLLSHHVPRSAAEQARLLKIYRLIQPQGVFKDPSKLYLGADLGAHLKRAGLRVKRRLDHFTKESVTALMRCYPNLSEGEKAAIIEAYRAGGRACGAALKKGGLYASWKWVLFAARKPAGTK